MEDGGGTMKTAVVTGGNGGLGRALAAGLQEAGWHTVLMDIDTTGLEATASQTPIAIDLTNPDQVADAVRQVVRSRRSIDMVIYNAGITQIGPFSDTPGDTHRKVFEINYFAAVDMARAFLEPIRASGGVHVAISSVAGFSPLYHRTAYAASKHALEGFFSSLRSEEAPHGVMTIIAAPSFVATNIGNDQRQGDGIARPGSASDGVDYMTPEAAARILLRGISKRQDFIPVGRVARLSWWISRLSPRLFQRLMERKIRGF